MKHTIGIDMEEISRIEKIVLEHPVFLKRFFTENERVEFEKKGKGLYQSVTGSFCAKEAFSKALGSGLSSFTYKGQKIICKLNSIEVLHDEFGKPYINLVDSLEVLNGVIATDVSITHTNTTAAAVVLMIFNDDE